MRHGRRHSTKSIPLSALAAALLMLLVVVPAACAGGDGGAEVSGQAAGTAMAQTLEGTSALISAVFEDADRYWAEQFEAMGKTYLSPALILYEGVLPAPSGAEDGSLGSFYSREERTLYIDLASYQDLRDNYAAVGDAAMGYIVAHAFGHAVQHQLGVLGSEGEQQSAVGEDGIPLWWRSELQADFYAGLAARQQGDLKWLREEDIERALEAAGAVWIERPASSYSIPEQRTRWFKLGYDTGDLSAGDTLTIPSQDL